MAISEKEVFEVMFSGMGPEFGIDLVKAFSKFQQNRRRDDKKKEYISFLKTPLPKEYQTAIKKAIGGMLKPKKRDYSFLSSVLDHITDGKPDFYSRWESAYKKCFKQYKDLTDEMFDSLKRGSVFEEEHIHNRLEYKRNIEEITTEQLSEFYPEHMEDFNERFERFNQNASKKKNLEGMLMNMSLFYRIPQSSRACQIDVFGRRIKSIQRIVEKVGRKWIKLIDKIESYKMENNGYYPEITYGDILIPDIFGFLILKNRRRDFGQRSLFSGLNVIEDSDNKPDHKNKGQRQVKFIDMDNGVLFDYHMFRTLNDLMDNEFARDPKRRKKVDRKKEVIPHEDYMQEQLREILDKDPLYEKIYEEIKMRASAIFDGCYTKPITETIYETYSRLSLGGRKDYLSRQRKKFIKELRSFQYDSKGSKRVGVGIPTLQSKLTNLLKCYTDEILKRFDHDVGDLCDSGIAMKVKDTAMGLVKLFEEITSKGGFRKKYKTKDLDALSDVHCLSVYVCWLNGDMNERYKKLKRDSEKEYKDHDVIRMIDHYKAKLDDFPDRFKVEGRVKAQTMFNIYKCLINSHKLLLNNTTEHVGGDVPHFSNLIRYIGEFNSFLKDNEEKLSSRQRAEVKTITSEYSRY